MADLAFVLLTLAFFAGLAFVVARIERSERANAVSTGCPPNPTTGESAFREVQAGPTS